MKKKVFTYAFLLIGFAHLVSCGKAITAQKVLDTSNKEVKVDLLFEIDGCKVYRFYDRANGGYNVPRYFTKCAGSSSTSWIETHQTSTPIVDANGQMIHTGTTHQVLMEIPTAYVKE